MKSCRCIASPLAYCQCRTSSCCLCTTEVTCSLQQIMGNIHSEISEQLYMSCISMGTSQLQAQCACIKVSVLMMSSWKSCYLLLVKGTREMVLAESCTICCLAGYQSWTLCGIHVHFCCEDVASAHSPKREPSGQHCLHKPPKKEVHYQKCFDPCVPLPCTQAMV